MFGLGKIGRGGLGSVNKQDPREGWQTLNLFVLALAELRGFAAVSIDSRAFDLVAHRRAYAVWKRTSSRPRLTHCRLLAVTLTGGKEQSMAQQPDMIQQITDYLRREGSRPLDELGVLLDAVAADWQAASRR